MPNTILFNRKAFVAVIPIVLILLTSTSCGLDPQAVAMKKLKKQNIRVSSQNLFKAIEMGDVKNTFLLLEAGIDINVYVDNKTPLIAAIESGKQKVVDHLLSKWVPDVTMKQNNGRTALMVAVEKINSPLLVQLIDLGADIDAPLNDGTTPLMRAVLGDSYELVDILLNSGADPRLKSNNKETALSIARDRDDEKLLRLLKKARS